jgi:hypothetical protein
MKRLILAAAIAAASVALAGCGGAVPIGDGIGKAPALVSPAQAAADKLGDSWAVAKLLTGGYVTTCAIAPSLAICSPAVVDIARTALTVGDVNVTAAQAVILAAGSDKSGIAKGVEIGRLAIEAFQKTVIGLGLDEASSGAGN